MGEARTEADARAGANDPDQALVRKSVKAEPWGAVLLLAFVSTLNILDRTLPAVLGELIKRDLTLSDTTLGLISGFGFLIVYSIAALPVARLADRRGYGVVISGCIVIWSGMTVVGGYAQAGWQLALCRTGVALGEAGTMPASQAFISNNFSEPRRARPMAVLSMSAPVSILGAMTIGGTLGGAVGWRKTFFVMGALSLFFAPIVRIALGSAGAGAQTRNAESLASALRLLLATRSYRWIMIGSVLVGIGSYSLNAFNTPFLMRVHGFSVAQAGAGYGIALGLFGSILLLLIGLVIDRLSSRDPRWPLWLVAMLYAAALPFAALSQIVDDRIASLVSMAIAACAGIGYMVPTIIAVHRLAPSSLRGTSSALMLLSVSIIGGIGPLVVGLISDALTPTLGNLALGRALWVVPIVFAGASLAFLAASRTYAVDVAQREAGSLEDEARI